MSAFLTVLALWLTSPALVWLWIKADERLADLTVSKHFERWEAEL